MTNGQLVTLIAWDPMRTEGLQVIEPCEGCAHAILSFVECYIKDLIER